MLKPLRRWASLKVLRKGAIAIVIIFGVSALYLWHLGTLSPGLSPAEASARQSSQHLQTVLDNPVNGPQRLLLYGLQAAGHHGALWMRLPSVALAILLLGLFYLLAKAWFGRVIGILATIMLATTSWIILLARSVTPDIMLLSPIAVLIIYNHLSRRNTKRRGLVWLALVPTIAISLYVPGLIWVVLVGTLVTHKQLLGLFKEIGRVYLILGFVLGLALLTPLIVSLVNNPSVGKNLVLWPEHWVGLEAALKGSVWATLSLVWRTQYHLSLIVGRLPILDVAQIVLAIFGTYALWVKARRQLIGLIGLLGFGILAAGINHNPLLITLGLPAIAILVAAGLRYLYLEWRSIFPHNPIPRVAAVFVMVALVSLHVVYGVRYSLIAWPHTVDTRQTYVLK